MNRKNKTILIASAIGLFLIGGLTIGIAKAKLGDDLKLETLFNLLHKIDVLEEIVLEDSQEDGEGNFLGRSLSSNYFCVSDVCTYYYSGSFLEASTTLFAIQNPFPPVNFSGKATTTGATTTLTHFTIDITGVSTSTGTFMMGTSTIASLANSASNISPSLVDQTVATSTQAFFSSGAGAGGITPNGTAVGGAGLTNMQLGPNEYITALMLNEDGSDDNGGVIGDNNTFSGTYTVEIKGPRY